MDRGETFIASGIDIGSPTSWRRSSKESFNFSAQAIHCNGSDSRDTSRIYKFQGLAFWVCVAAAETAVLDMLGKLSGKSIGQLLGEVRSREIAVYRASGNRGNRPEEEIEFLQQLI